MIDITKPLQTRDGKPARITEVNAGNQLYPLRAEVTHISGNRAVYSYSSDGRFYFSGPESVFDLVNVPESAEANYWVGVGPQRTLESLRKAGFKIEVSNGDQLGATKYKHRVLLSKDGASAQSNCDELQQAIDRAHELWQSTQLRDYKVRLYVFDNGIVTSSVTECEIQRVLGAKQIACKEVNFRACPGDNQ